MLCTGQEQDLRTSSCALQRRPLCRRNETPSGAAVRRIMAVYFDETDLAACIALSNKTLGGLLRPGPTWND